MLLCKLKLTLDEDDLARNHGVVLMVVALLQMTVTTTFVAN
jgi:hypothetical protein